MAGNDPLETVHAALARHPGLGRRGKIRIDVLDGVIALDGTLTDIAARRLIPRIAAEASGLGVQDRLRLDPGRRREDAAISAEIEAALSTDSLFAGYEIGKTTAGESLPQPARGRAAAAFRPTLARNTWPGLVRR